LQEIGDEIATQKALEEQYMMEWEELSELADSEN